MSQVRVHQLAAELAIESGEVIAFLESQGRRVRGPSAVLGESAAAGVRRHFRAPDQPARPTSRPPSPAVQQSPSPVRPEPRSPRAASGPAPAYPATSLLNPFAVTDPAGPTAMAAPAPPRAPVAAPVARPDLRPTVVLSVLAPTQVRPSGEELERDWLRRDIGIEERAGWIEAGLRLDEAGLAAQCRIAGISPADLGLRLSGQTAVHRLRGGESATSVWARIQDGEHQPRRGTRLTGRFQLS